MNVIYDALVVNEFHSNCVMLISREGHEIAVVYFRCGYDPDNYESGMVGIIIIIITTTTTTTTTSLV